MEPHLYADIAADIVSDDTQIRDAIGAPKNIDPQWFRDRWLGAGTYGRAYAVDWYGEPAVFKLTRDVDECDVAERATEQQWAIRGIAYVHLLAWLDVPPHGEGLPHCLMVTERADTFLLDWRANAMAACMFYLDRFDWPYDNPDHWHGLTQNMTKEQRETAATWVEDLRAGLKWIGDVPIPDTNDGNAGIVLRQGREMAVWVDFGQWG